MPHYGKLLLLCTATVAATTACSTLSPKEIQSLDRIAFASLELAPSVEPNDLRLDIIRQVRTTFDNSGTHNYPVPNDPLGFDLGNGVFYDLNENFSLRLDMLLGFAGDNRFVLSKSDYPLAERGSRVYNFENDSLTTSFSQRNRSRYKYHHDGPPDSLSYMHGNALDYVIVRRDSALVCRNKRKVKKEITSQSESTFTLKRGRKESNFTQKDKVINLQSRYLVTLTDSDRTITINGLTRKGRRVSRYTLLRSRNALYVFDQKLRGQKIVFEDGILSVFKNNNLVAKYELLPDSRAEATSMLP